MSYLPSISDALRIITERTDEAIQANPAVSFGNGLAKRVYFMHGHPKEIVQVLQEYTKSAQFKNKKYPLIALFRDIKEKLSEGAFGLTTSYRPRLVILTLTKREYRAETRKIKNFDPILIPILEEFINQIRISEFFGSPTIEELNIEKWDRYFWGTDAVDKNIFNDYIDAIEIVGMDLKQDNIIC